MNFQDQINRLVVIQVKGNPGFRRSRRIGVAIQKARRALWFLTHDFTDPYLVPPAKTWTTRNERRTSIKTKSEILA